MKNVLVELNESSAVIRGITSENAGLTINLQDGTQVTFNVKSKEAKKAEEKKAEKKEKQDKLKEAQQTSDDDDTITISAGSIEELIKKINDYTFSMKSDNVQTEAELQVGQHIDFRG